MPLANLISLIFLEMIIVFTPHPSDYFSDDIQVNNEVTEQEEAVIEKTKINLRTINPKPDPVTEKRDAPPCDYEALEQQLTQILEGEGWYEHEVPLMSSSSTVITKYPYMDRDLPFGYSAVCTVKLLFKESFEERITGVTGRKSFFYDYSYQSDFVELGGQTFYGNPADGPNTSADVVPILSDTGGLQYLMMSSISRSGGKFPDKFCPCTNEYEAWLTAPMYPEET